MLCTAQYDPVCGCNNKTYPNACAAECAGITTYTKGACPQDAVIDLEGSAWQLTAFSTNGELTPIPDNLTIFIKLETGKLQGNGGCNTIGGAYILDGNSLTVSNLISTKMYCEVAMPWETKFMEWLGHSASYTLQDKTLEIICGDMTKLVFKPQ